MSDYEIPVSILREIYEKGPISLAFFDFMYELQHMGDGVIVYVLPKPQPFS